MVKHRAQLLLMSETMSRKQLSQILIDFVDSIQRRVEAEEGKAEILVIDDMEDED